MCSSDLVGWTGSYYGYRGYLKDLLLTCGMDFEFVGTRNENSEGLVDRYKNYYGVSGWRIEYLSQDIEEGRCIPGDDYAKRVDIVVCLIGTNNITLSRAYNYECYEKLLDDLSLYFPTSRKICATIIPLPVRDAYLTEEFCEDVRTLVVQKGFELCELNEGFPKPCTEYLVDGVHPNDEGYKYIADKFYRAICSEK